MKIFCGRSDKNLLKYSKILLKWPSFFIQSISFNNNCLVTRGTDFPIVFRTRRHCDFIGHIFENFFLSSGMSVESFIGLALMVIEIISRVPKDHPGPLILKGLRCFL